MKSVDKIVARRKVIEAGVVGVAYLVLPEGCSSPSSESADSGPRDSTTPDSSQRDSVSAADVGPEASAAPDTGLGTGPEPDATLVEGGGDCTQDDWTRPISIAETGIAAKGTAYAFNDPRFADLFWNGDRILVIHPLGGTGYVAMSGVCTHKGCCPQYVKSCAYSGPLASGDTPYCIVQDSDAGEGGGMEGGEEAGPEAAPPEGGLDANSDGETDAVSSDASSAGMDGGLYTDVLYCPCHGSLYDAITGNALQGPAMITGSLQLMKTCEGGGYVFVTIPNNGFGAGSPPTCMAQ